MCRSFHKPSRAAPLVSALSSAAFKEEEGGDYNYDGDISSIMFSASSSSLIHPPDEGHQKNQQLTASKKSCRVSFNTSVEIREYERILVPPIPVDVPTKDDIIDDDDDQSTDSSSETLSTSSSSSSSSSIELLYEPLPLMLGWKFNTCSTSLKGHATKTGHNNNDIEDYSFIFGRQVQNECSSSIRRSIDGTSVMERFFILKEYGFKDIDILKSVPGTRHSTNKTRSSSSVPSWLRKQGRFLVFSSPSSSSSSSSTQTTESMKRITNPLRSVRRKTWSAFRRSNMERITTPAA